MKRAILLAIQVVLATLLPLQATAQVVALDQGQSIDEKRTGWLPYIFATDSLGTALGVGGVTAGTLQPQTSLFGTAFVTSNESALLFGSLSDLRLGQDSRFFLDTSLLVDHFTDQRFYASPPRPNVPRAGSNDSDEEDYVTGVSNEVTFEANLKYRLPIGNLTDDPVAVYRLKQGLLESGPQGGDVWNPMTSGQTTLGARYFYTYRDLTDFVFNESDDTPSDIFLTAKTNGLDFWLEYDNTDFPANPTRGSRQLLRWQQDFGWFDSDSKWTNLKADLSKYFDLGTSDWFRQKVLALNFWTSNSPSWEEDGPRLDDGRPLPNYGSSLGGFDRLRAYPSNRFYDKSAVYYAAELRLIPQTQPLRDIPILNYFEIDWWQVVPFIEAGRVGPEYDSDLFFKDLKWDVGIGIRLMAFRSVVRLDFAAGEEGGAIWAMVQQPFARQGR